MSRLSEVAAGAGVAAALVVAFVLCALAAVILPKVQATHMWISLFTSAPVGSVTAWITGILSSGVTGFVGGWVFAWKYNKVVAWMG